MMGENTHMVKIHDRTMGYGSIRILHSGLSKAVAKSIAKHYSKQLRKTENENRSDLDIAYFVENRYVGEPDLDYWR